MAAYKGKGVVVSALITGVASYLSKKENRDKTMKLFKDLRSKAGSLIGSQPTDQINRNNSLKEIAETAAGSTATKIQENNFINEGGSQTGLEYYNENVQPLQR